MRRAPRRALRGAGAARILSRSTSPVFCRFWWPLASAYLGETAEAWLALEAVLADPEEGGLAALYGTHGFLCEVLRWDGDLDGALAHGLRATELAAERGSPLSRVEAGAFLGTAALQRACGPRLRAASPRDPRGGEDEGRGSRCGTSAPRGSARAHRSRPRVSAGCVRRGSRRGAGDDPAGATGCRAFQQACERARRIAVELGAGVYEEAVTREARAVREGAASA